MIRVQFLDLKVNRDRWVEEVALLEEELKRTQTYFRRVSSLLHLRSFEYYGGYAAYLARMASVYSRLADGVQNGNN